MATQTINKVNNADMYNVFVQAPVPICIFEGANYTIEFANHYYLQVTGKDETIIGKPFLESFPELKKQGLLEILDTVMANGIPYHINEHEVFITRNNKKEQSFFNCIYQPFKEADGTITGVIVVFTEVTEQVLLKKINVDYQQKLVIDLNIANNELAFQKEEKIKRADELGIANIELAFQGEEKVKRADELGIANIELAYQDDEKEKRADELIIANKELAFQNDEKEKRANELIIANKELAFQNDEKEKRADELIIANKELAFQNVEKEKRADELIIANKELIFQNEEKDKRAAELVIAEYSRSLIEASLDPLVTINTEGKITDVNEASIKVTGVSRENLIGTDFSNYFTEPIKAQEGYLQVFEKSFVSNYALTIKHINGDLTDVLYNASVYKDVKGNVLGVFAAARDITSQKQIEDELLKTQERLNAGLKIANIALSEISYITNTVQLSPESAAMYGFPKNQLEATRQQMHDTFHPAIKAELEAQIIVAMNADNSGQMALEHPILLPSGEVRWLKVNKQFFYDNSTQPAKPVYSILVSQDITERKESSQYARSLIEASLDPLVTISADGKITDVNEASIKVTGIEREKLIGTDFSNYFTEPQKAQEGYQQVFEKGFRADYPLTIKHKNGNLTDVLYNASVYKDDIGNVLGVFAAARDVTEQTRIEKELTEAKIFAEHAQGKAEEATRTAEDAVKAKQQFLSNMSHEIRTPMNAIIGFTKVVLKTDLSVKQKEYISAIKTSGDALIVLINDILDLAKVDAGKMSFEQTPFKMATSISAMLHLFETKIQERNLDLLVMLDNAIPEVLLGDSVRLHQIILNLVSNAVKFTDKGKITVSVKLLSQDANNVTIHFAVADTGIGIIDEKIDTIFENFQQASSTTARLYGGTGLGLAIVKQLVEAQGGSITVQSKLHEGSVFSFILPYKKTNEVTATEADMAQTELKINNIKVLVVEDMPLNQLLMKTILDDFGFEREIAENGRVAVEKVQKNVYDIILMDLQMPEMNGFEATEYIRNTIKSKIPIIALTADVTTADLKKCMAVGMNDYIAKPVDDQLLYSKMMTVLKKAQDAKSIIAAAVMVSEVIKERYINMDYLLRRTKANPVLIMEMITLYLEQTPPLVALMKQSLEAKDWQALHAAVHKMIPSFAIMGINAHFENMAKQIQEYANTQLKSEGIQDLVLQLENVCVQVCKELEEEFIRIKNNN